MTLRKYGLLITVSILTALIAVEGCSTNSRHNRDMVDAEFYFNRGKTSIERKDYLEAITNFQTVVESFSGSDLVDDAQYMLGEARYSAEEYITAAFEYERVYADYPTSPFAPEAQYKKALCYFMVSPKASLDQENTFLAIDEFYRFIDNYPANPFVKDAQEHIAELSEKLAYKEFTNAEFYLKMKIFDAALIYFQSVIDDYPRSTWADHARLGLAKVYMRQEDFDSARNILVMLVNADIENELKQQASDQLEELEYLENNE